MTMLIHLAEKRAEEEALEAALPILGPCILCSKPTRRACGLCMRASEGKDVVPICPPSEANGACQVQHVKEKHPIGGG
jgi:hypothetical protein